MTGGIYDIDTKVWETWSKKRYLVNNLLVLGFYNKKTIKYAGTKYKDIIGVSVDPRRGVMELSKGMSTCSVAIEKDPDKILVEKDGVDVSITIL